MADVLIADDEKGLLQSLAQFLRDRGLDVTTASTGREALVELCRKSGEGGTFDALILDLKMPDMDGWEVLRAVRCSPLWKPMPVIVMSGYVDTARDYMHVNRYNGVLVEKKEDFT